MICDHPDCTGVHNVYRPQREWCPVFVARRHTENLGAVERYRSTVKGFKSRLREGARQRGTR